ncbi:Leucine-rich repeat protein [Plasmopara halstedii]|uniref:Leucine-rich repeat protein n=1 Tax=Plasmopara halstedii TaxID=4781 RepID=A0A0N7L4J0_PLAHL|nr:Leucine-rich repeat protein [Plasmopara halstedii]CEG38811.1 Leucine-rich repeat protein [Plasmopara halstedii]|eukprot:XP_024575180.1 Leucine-rich repeat protein [Plasmopara halstedii]
MQGRLWQKNVVLAPARNQIALALRGARKTGFLSLPARDFTEIPPQVYHLEDHLEKDENKWECVDLFKMDLSHNQLSSISDEIGDLAAVTSIKLANNLLQVLPERLYELRALTYLDLSNNQLGRDLSENFGTLINMKELNLSGNKLSRLPDSVIFLKNMKVLHIAENVLTALPTQIGELERLKILNAHTNQLTSLPSSLGRLEKLQNLNLNKNSLVSTDDILSTLSLLQVLDLRQNKLAVFPLLPRNAKLDQVFLSYNTLSTVDELSILRLRNSVTVLDLRDNKLTSLPATIASLFRLKTLNVANNDLPDLPPGLGYLKYLNHLSVYGNPLRAIRRSVVSAGCESLKKYLRTRGLPPDGSEFLEEERDEFQIERERLAYKGSGTHEGQPLASDCSTKFRDAAASRTLDLTNSCLYVLPSDLVGKGRFSFGSTLIHLNLSLNHLRLLPAVIGELMFLKTLTADENDLEILHSSIAALPRLEVLRLRKNYLTADAIADFLRNSTTLGTTLKEIDLRSNKLSIIPVETGQLRSLENLLLSHNQIEALDQFPWSHLTKVSVIDLSDNKLRSLGRIYDAPLLQSLSFENNNITKVPVELGLCLHLSAIYMNGNPQRTVRGGVIAKGSAEVVAYLKNKLPLDTALVPPIPVALARKGEVDERVFSASSRSKGGAHLRRHGETYAAHGFATGKDHEAALVALPESKTSINFSTEKATVDFELSRLSTQIQQLEQHLKSNSLSAATRFGLKKKLAMVRSKRIREIRKQ